jgi:hypothetical protein
MDLHPDLKDLFAELSASSAEYLIVGAWAVGFYAEPRFTKDLDLLIGHDDANLAKVVAALERFGAPPGVIEQAKTLRKDEFLFFGSSPTRIDLLRAIPGVEFAAAWERRESTVWDGVPVHVLSFADLVTAKRAAGRRKDLEDLRLLERAAKATGK